MPQGIWPDCQVTESGLRNSAQFLAAQFLRKSSGSLHRFTFGLEHSYRSGGVAENREDSRPTGVIRPSGRRRRRPIRRPIRSTSCHSGPQAMALRGRFPPAVARSEGRWGALGMPLAPRSADEAQYLRVTIRNYWAAVEAIRSEVAREGQVAINPRYGSSR